MSSADEPLFGSARATPPAGCAAFVRGLVTGGEEALGAAKNGPAAAVLLVALYHAARLSAFDRLRELLAELRAPVWVDAGPGGGLSADAFARRGGHVHFRSGLNRHGRGETVGRPPRRH
jgi:hypothetical protein